MSAAAASARAPLSQEANAYWESLVDDCRRQSQAINTVVSQRGWPNDHFIECRPGSELRIVKSHCPSTDIKLTINYCAWGPMIDGVVTGHEDENLEFGLEEFTIPIATDADGSVVAVYDEGRSFSPHELALYLMQRFRRCFPGVSLPC